ncbi:MAG: hypothetical protein CMP91_09120 [Gammaproteobacteria bacterium]|nr:hypothetical protein [Gammaproteobacteria bacterium]MAY02337.1 hypothetical protein [Gammaproteobacteria bacterium]|tara:strand:+ start:463181 stop:463693 length:513 start_codon:yes stop_codon:yes gene_type:complete
MDEQDFPDDNQLVSKSQRKREMLALQDLGKQLTTLDEKLLAKCQLPARLMSAIDEYKRLPNKHGAKKRQLQFIGKIMRDIDTDNIEKVIQQQNQQVNLDRRLFQGLELMRDELIAGSDSALQSLIADHPELDIQHIRQLIRQAQKEAEQNKAPQASRKLFRYLRELKQSD